MSIDAGDRETQRLLGSLETAIKSVNGSIVKMDEKLDTVGETVVRIDSSVRSAWKKIEEHNKHIEDFKKIKNQAFGIATFVGFLGGIVGFIIDHIFK